MSNQADARDEQVAEQVGVDTGRDQRPLESPDAALGVRCRSTLAIASKSGSGSIAFQSMASSISICPDRKTRFPPAESG
ncbi:MAG: hypothetical protein H0U08_11595 [Actinobacteria bacterium]|nr:hypothetical protein [Actinomycetota bacterium]